MSVNDLQSFRLGNRDMVESYSHDETVPAMRPVNPGKLLPIACSKSHPEIAEFGDHRSWDVSEVHVGREVREGIVKD